MKTIPSFVFHLSLKSWHKCVRGFVSPGAPLQPGLLANASCVFRRRHNHNHMRKSFLPHISGKIWYGHTAVWLDLLGFLIIPHCTGKFPVPVSLNINCTSKSSQVVLIIQIKSNILNICFAQKKKRKLKPKSRRMITGAVCMCATQERPTCGFCAWCALFDLPKHKTHDWARKKRNSFSWNTTCIAS